MRDVMAHRGPDDSGIMVDGPVGLAHRRLSILDLSELGHQPMASADGRLWIVFNGEIYNFQALRDDLGRAGHTFRSHTDTEVILCLYREHGTRCLEFLRGMFAFALWDRESQQLFLARDRIGKKPLYYSFDGKSLAFGSELKAVLKDPSITREIDFEAFYDYFKYGYIPDPKTIYRHVRKLEPGHFLTCSAEGLRKTRYWDISFRRSVHGDEEAIGEQLLELLGGSVRLRLVSDVPLGAFLSGGIDSSAVVGLMAQSQNGPVETFTIGFDSQDFDEVEFARTIAARFRTRHHEFTVRQNVLQVLPSLVEHFDEPFADSSAVPTYYVSQVARRHVTVALAGDGGDENFAGYEKYRLDAIENRARSLVPAVVRRCLLPRLSRLLSDAKGGVLQKGATFFRALAAEPAFGFYLTNTQFNGPLWSRIVNEDTRRAIGDYDPFSVTEQYYRQADTDDHLSRLLYTDMKTYLPGDILVKVDRMSMAHSLEVRAPLLDHKVVEFVAGLPPTLKFRSGVKKYVLKQALRRLLPPDTLHRRKVGFSAPLADWFREELRDYTAKVLLAADARVGTYFHGSVIRRLWELHQTRQRDFSSILWTLLIFELWHRRYL